MRAMRRHTGRRGRSACQRTRPWRARKLCGKLRSARRCQLRHLRGTGHIPQEAHQVAAQRSIGYLVRVASRRRPLELDIGAGTPVVGPPIPRRVPATGAVRVPLQRSAAAGICRSLRGHGADLADGRLAVGAVHQRLRPRLARLVQLLLLDKQRSALDLLHSPELHQPAVQLLQLGLLQRKRSAVRVRFPLAPGILSARARGPLARRLLPALCRRLPLPSRALPRRRAPA